MKRWDTRNQNYTENKHVDNFLEEIAGVCKKYGLSIGHEDDCGSFLIHNYNKNKIKWLKSASISAEFTNLYKNK